MLEKVLRRSPIGVSAADYDADGLYWAFYKSGEYLMTGVDTTEIADGEQYELVCTAA